MLLPDISSFSLPGVMLSRFRSVSRKLWRRLDIVLPTDLDFARLAFLSLYRFVGSSSGIGEHMNRMKSFPDGLNAPVPFCTQWNCSLLSGFIYRCPRNPYDSLGTRCLLDPAPKHVRAMVGSRLLDFQTILWYWRHISQLTVRVEAGVIRILPETLRHLPSPVVSPSS